MRNVRSAVAVVSFLIALSSFAQVSEYPPNLLPDFFSIPLDGGRVQSIAVHPTDNRRIITANQFGGLWKTVDGGAHWFHLDGLPTVLAVDVAWGADGRTIIATLSRDNRVFNGGGIWVSHDEGFTWTHPPTGTPCGNERIPARPGAYGISFAPDEPETVYAGTDYGIAVSRDNGDTWTHQMLELTSPVASDRFQNAVRSVLALPERRVLALSRTGLWRSDDRGATWRNARPGDFTYGWGFKSMDTLPDDPDKVLIVDSYDRLLLYQVAVDSFSDVAAPGGGSRGPFVRTSRADGGRFDVWIGSGVNLHRVTVSSVSALLAVTPASWTALHRAQGIHDDSGYLAVDGDRRPLLYGSDGGIFKPSDASATAWTRAGTGAAGLNSIQMTDVHATNVMRSDGTTASVSLYFATQDNGLWNSSDGGATWPRADCAEGFFFEGPTRMASGSTITMAWGKVGCGPSPSMFSNADFASARAVPDVDTAGNALANMSQAFYLDTNQWVRYRTPPGASPQVWTSSDDGQHWRRRATVNLEIRGVFQSALGTDGRVIFAPFRGLDGTAGAERIGLIRITDPFAAAQTLGESNLLYLPDGGSLGVRATEFDWHAVYGVHPRDPRFIIAPDIRNGDVKVTRNGGAMWSVDHELTDLVTDHGNLLMYDDQYHMQVNDIAFDPFDNDRIFVATRDAGVILSEDAGATWRRIPGSESILYGTGFGFQPDRTVYVSSYGRGLWKIEFPDFSGTIGRIDELILCAIFDCRIIPFPDPREREFDFKRDPLVLVRSGRILGMDVGAKRELRTLYVTPGSVVLRYSPDGTMPNFKVAETKKAGAFAMQKTLEKDVLSGVVFQDGLVAYTLSTPKELTAQDIAKGVVTANRKPAAGGVQQQRKPYLIVTTSMTVAGQPILGEDRKLWLTGYDFPAGAKIAVRIDDRPVEAGVKIAKDGRLQGQVLVPEDLPEGLHTVQLEDQRTQYPVVLAKSTFVIVAMDDFERKQ